MKLFAIFMLVKAVFTSVSKNKEADFEYYNQKYPKQNKRSVQLSRKFDETIKNMRNEIIKRNQKDNKSRLRKQLTSIKNQIEKKLNILQRNVEKSEQLESSISEILKKSGVQKEDDNYDKYYANQTMFNNTILQGMPLGIQCENSVECDNLNNNFFEYVIGNMRGKDGKDGKKGVKGSVGEKGVQGQEGDKGKDGQNIDNNKLDKIISSAVKTNFLKIALKNRQLKQIS